MTRSVCSHTRPVGPHMLGRQDHGQGSSVSQHSLMSLPSTCPPGLWLVTPPEMRQSVNWATDIRGEDHVPRQCCGHRSQR